MRIEDIEDNHIVTVNMHCVHDVVTCWIADMYCTGILRYIDRSNILDAHIVSMCWTAIYIALDIIDQRIVSTIHIARLILADQYILQQPSRKTAPLRSFILNPSVCIVGRLRNILYKSIVLHIVLTKESRQKIISSVVLTHYEFIAMHLRSHTKTKRKTGEPRITPNNAILTPIPSKVHVER